jgi:hypothetical protein
MMIRELDAVVLVRDIPGEGLKRGDLGAVVHVHGSDAFEVEFVRASGKMQALVRLSSADLRLLEDSDVPAVRSASSQRGAA